MRLFSLFLCIALTACQVQGTNPLEIDTLPQEDSIVQKPLEQVPSELSIDHFASMRLEGTDFSLGQVLADNNVYTRYAIEYRSNGLLISGILNLPKGEGPFPLLLLNHGYIDRSVYTRGRGLKREQDFLARQGFAVLHADYRGHAQSDPSPLPDETSVYDAGLEYSMDVINAIHAVREADLPSIDTEHVGMLGHSMGGGIALNIAVAYPELVDAIVLYAPVHSDAWENFVRWRSERQEGSITLDALGTRETHPAAWDRLSSLAHLDQLQAPVLLFQGTLDADVPKEWSDFLEEQLIQRGKQIDYIVYNGERHEFGPQWNDFMQRTDVFFKNYLISQQQWHAPVAQADKRITKKPFGIFITPESSPVSPEKFRGYHTGVDYELFPGEQAHSVSFFAICHGEIVRKQRVGGYGGVVVQQCTMEHEPVTVLYGHVSLSSIAFNVGDSLRAGEAIGVLGEGYSEETDGERPHLHLAIHKGNQVQWAGYVSSEEELSSWVDLETLL